MTIFILIALFCAAALVILFRNRSSALKKTQTLRRLTTGVEKIQPPRTDTAQTDESDKTTPPLADVDYSEVNRAYRIADMHFARGDFEEAEKWFIRVLARHEYHPEALNRLGVIYIQQNNPRRAEILYRKLFAITQKEPAYYANYGRCLYNQGRLNEALEAYENAVKLDATRPARFVSIGQIYYEQKEYIKALTYFLRALDLDPQNIGYLSVAAELAREVGDFERAHRSLKKILELDPYNEEAKRKLETLSSSG